jgi:RsiW-degrading membrane proteinase PrsW (M82 family)
MGTKDTTSATRPNKFWAYVAVLVGLVLCVGGIAVATVYLELPYTVPGEGLLGPFFPWQETLWTRVGQITALSLGLIGGSLAVFHGIRSILNLPSRRMKLPPTYAFWVVFALALGLGNLSINLGLAVDFLFPVAFLLGAALPTLGVLAWAGRRLGWPATWRQGGLSLVSGSTLSILATIHLATVLPILSYLVIEPLTFPLFEFWDNTIGLFSSEVFFFLLIVALQAPIPEELTKALGPGLMGRRIKDERQAFFVGLASGAGFAILENMLYEGIYASWSGWTWGGITLLRGIGSVLHPLGTGIIALALFRARKREKGWFGRLARAYLLAVGLHTLWNGGYDLLLYLTGMSYYTGGELDVYGEPMGVLLIAFLLVLSAGLWWLLRRITTTLATEEEVEAKPVAITARGLAAWAVGCALIIVPLGAALGRAWDEVLAAILGGG